MKAHASEMSGRRRFGRRWQSRLEPPDDLNELADFLLAQEVQFLMEQFDLKLRLGVNAIVGLGGGAVDRRLPILAHHDDRGGIGGLKRQREIEKYEGVGVPLL